MPVLAGHGYTRRQLRDDIPHLFTVALTQHLARVPTIAVHEFLVRAGCDDPARIHFDDPIHIADNLVRDDQRCDSEGFSRDRCFDFPSRLSIQVFGGFIQN